MAKPGDNMDLFEVVFSFSALHDLRALRKYEQQIVMDGIYSQLLNEPARETSNRKRMRSNGVANWEMRVGSQLYIRGEKRKL